MSARYAEAITPADRVMTPKERAVAALTLQIPDMVPPFELEFQLEEDMFGQKFMTEELQPHNLAKLSGKAKEQTFHAFAEYVVHVYQSLEYSIIPGPYLGSVDQRIS